MNLVLFGNLALGVALTLGGCGGGGGGSVDSVVPDGPTTRSAPPPSGTFSAAEYEKNYGLEAIGADHAYAVGGTGRGIKVGVIDTGIDVDHPDLVGGIDPASTDIVTGSAANLNDAHGHGTAVAGIIGARRNGLDAHGVAFESSVLAVRADRRDTESSGGAFWQSDIARATDYAANAGARVINYSIAGSELSTDLAAALNRAAEKNSVLVMAAGNDGGADPAATAAYNDPAVAGRLIAVGAVDQNNAIAAFSNRAGTAQQHYLVAPGVDIVTTALGGGTAGYDGTSFAAPHVAGAAATLMSAAPYLTGQNVTELLLSTARDLGEPGVDPVYGRGMVDLEAALRPQGETVVPTGDTVAIGGTPLSETELRLGAAFGDAFSASAALSETAFVDGYGRTYTTDLGARVGAGTSAPDLEHWLAPATAAAVGGDAAFGRAVGLVGEERATGGMARTGENADAQPLLASALTFDLSGGTEATISRGIGVQSGLGLTGSGSPMVSGSLDAPFAAVAPGGDAAMVAHDLADGWRVAYGIAESENGVREVSTRLGELSRRWQNGVHVGIQMGALEERGSILGGEAGGAFATSGDADTGFGTVFADVPLSDRISLQGAYTRGRTDVDAKEGSMLQDFTTIGSSAFGLGVEVDSAFTKADRLTFTASRPLRVDSGSVDLNVPVGRTMAGAVVRREESVELSPSGEELDLGLSFMRPVGPGEIQFDAGVRFEPGHNEAKAPEHLFGAKFRIPF